MIIAIRRYLKGPGFKAILWLTLISVAGFWGIPSLFKRGSRGGAGGPAVATVNGVEISGHEFNRVTNIQQEFIRRLRVQYGQYADLFIQAMGLNSDPKTMALDMLIRDLLVNETAHEININITPGYMESRLENPEFIQKQLTQILPTYVFDEGGFVNPVALNRYLSQERLTGDDLNDLIREALAREMTLEFVGIAAYAPQFALQEEFLRDHTQKQYSILHIPFDPVLRKEQTVALADAEIKKYFDAQNRSSKHYWTPEKRNGTTWTFDIKKFGITVDDKEAEAYYQDHRGQKFVSVPMKIEARTIVFKGDDQGTLDKAFKVKEELMTSPELFAAKAKELSEDKETAKNGGLVPFFSKGTYDKAFEKAVFLLKNDGDISEPVATTRGIEVVQRVAKKPAEFKSFDAVKGEIKELLVVEKFKEQFADSLRALIDQNVEDGYRKFFEEHGAIQGSVSMVQGDKAAKTLAGLREKGSMTFFFENNSAVVVRLDEIIKREVPALEAVRAQVEKDLHAERAERAFGKLVKETAAKASRVPLAELSKAIGGTVDPVDWLVPGDTKALEALKKKEVPVEALARLDKIGSIAMEIGPKDACIVRLDNIKDFDTQAFQERKQELQKKFGRENSVCFVEGFVASLYRNATIKTSEEMVNTAREDDYTTVEDYF